MVRGLTPEVVVPLARHMTGQTTLVTLLATIPYIAIYLPLSRKELNSPPLLSSFLSSLPSIFILFVYFYKIVIICFL